jgi:hypothetical protein
MLSSSVIVAFITGVLGPVILLYVKNRLEKKEKPDMVKETLQVSELITSKIEHFTTEDTFTQQVSQWQNSVLFTNQSHKTQIQYN